VETATPPRALCGCAQGPSTDDTIDAEIERLATEAGIVPHGPEAFRRRDDHLLDRNRGPHPVYLNVYHLVQGRANRGLHRVGLGVFHSGVQVHGEEWSFGAPATPEEITGVFTVAPMEAVGELHAHVYLGTTTLTREQLRTIHRRVCVEWPAIEYDVLNKNCNHFCEAFCKLISTHMQLRVPRWVNRTSRWSGKLVPRAAANGAIKLFTSEEPPKCKAPDYNSNTGSDVREAAKKECRVDRVAMHFQVSAVMQTTLTPKKKKPEEEAATTPTPAAAAATPPQAAGSSGAAASTPTVTPPRPGGSHPPPREPPKPGFAPTAARTTSVTFRTSSHLDPSSPPPAIGAIVSPDGSPVAQSTTASRRADARVTFVEGSSAGNAAVGEPAAAGSGLGAGGRRGSSGISPLLAPPDGFSSSNASPQVSPQAASPASQRPPTYHSRGPSETAVSDAGADETTGDLDSTHRTSSPQHAVAGSQSQRTLVPDDDEQTLTFTQTVDHHTLAAPAAAVDAGDLSDHVTRMPTAAQEVSEPEGSPLGFGDQTGTFAADRSATAGISENNAFRRASTAGDATLSAGADDGSAIRRRIDTDGGPDAPFDATFSDPGSGRGASHHRRVESEDPLELSATPPPPRDVYSPRGGGEPDNADNDASLAPDDGGDSPIIVADGHRAARRSSAAGRDSPAPNGVPSRRGSRHGSTVISKTLSLRDIRLPIDEQAAAEGASSGATPVACATGAGSAERDHVPAGEERGSGPSESGSACSVNLADI